MAIHHLETAEDVKAAIKDKKGVLLDFYAEWCGPCKAIAPFVEEIWNNEKYKDIFFAKVDVDQLPELSDELGILAVPTFLLFKDEERAGELVDPKPDTLVKLVEKGL